MGQIAMHADSLSVILTATPPQGYIHVHHLKAMSRRGGRYEVDPIKDLRPICPNCHAVIHRQNPPLSIVQLRQMLKKAQKSQP
jgi:5-methylcytosine-specific restriction protein A